MIVIVSNGNIFCHFRQALFSNRKIQRGEYKK